MKRYTNYELGLALNKILTADVEQLKELKSLYKLKLSNQEEEDVIMVERVLQVIEILIQFVDDEPCCDDLEKFGFCGCESFRE